eukprot:439797-Pyramimonas_sp.AAC.1
MIILRPSGGGPSGVPRCPAMSAVARANSRQMILLRPAVAPAVSRGAPWRPVASAFVRAKSRQMIIIRPAVALAVSRGGPWCPVVSR